MGRAWGYSPSAWTFYIPQPPAVHPDSLGHSAGPGFVPSVPWECSLCACCGSWLCKRRLLHAGALIVNRDGILEIIHTDPAVLEEEAADVVTGARAVEMFISAS